MCVLVFYMYMMFHGANVGHSHPVVQDATFVRFPQMPSFQKQLHWNPIFVFKYKDFMSQAVD